MLNAEKRVICFAHKKNITLQKSSIGGQMQMEVNICRYCQGILQVINQIWWGITFIHPHYKVCWIWAFQWIFTENGQFHRFYPNSLWIRIFRFFVKIIVNPTLRYFGWIQRFFYNLEIFENALWITHWLIKQCDISRQYLIAIIIQNFYFLYN